MKKFLIIFLILLTILSVSHYKKINLYQLDLTDNYFYYLYVNDKNFSCSNCEVIPNGNSVIVKTTKNNSEKVFNLSNSISGEALQIFTNNSSKKFNELRKTLKLKNLNSYYVNGKKVYEGYSNLLNNFIINKGKKINVQISLNDNSLIIGYPLILHSF